MKTTKSFIPLILLLLSCSINAQQVSLSKQALPIDKKTNCYIRYYYFPNIEAYFDNLKMVYHYRDKGVWTTAPELPQNYGGYSLYNKAHVEITNYDDDDPYKLILLHKKIYPYNSKGRFAYATTIQGGN
jgi:hypothetical protein